MGKSKKHTTYSPSSTARIKEAITVTEEEEALGHGLRLDPPLLMFLPVLLAMAQPVSGKSSARHQVPQLGYFSS